MNQNKDWRKRWQGVLVALIVFVSAAPSDVRAQSSMVHAFVTTQMSEEGKVDATRLFIFEFFYRGPTPGYEASCSVQTIIVNNVNCSKAGSIGSGRGIWLKHEYASNQYTGDSFRCEYITKKGAKDAELSIIIPVLGEGTITHRMLIDTSTNKLRDYRGTLSKTSAMLNRVIDASYVPIVEKSPTSGGWEDVDLGCAKMSTPVLRR